MLRPYLKIWDWDLNFGHAVKAISSPGVRSSWRVHCTYSDRTIINTTSVMSLHVSSFEWIFRVQKKGLQPILPQYATVNGRKE